MTHARAKPLSERKCRRPAAPRLGGAPDLGAVTGRTGAVIAAARTIPTAIFIELPAQGQAISLARGAA
ncbi:hypothetical protein V5F59_00970 [Xanthobacter autotrophicus DSM 431]|uniref:hypothetical protein n=1 Tax=Xanthobacter nonsaccharivorans TaxID=3119912 RepID=UPI00372C76FB